MTYESTAYAKPLSSLGIISNLANASDLESKKCISLLSDADQFIRNIKVPKESNLTFTVDGIPFHARNVPNGDVAQLIIWGTLGYLPYSVTSVENRRALVYILESLRCQTGVTFGVDAQMRIVVTKEFQIPNPPSPTYLFTPLLSLIQEVRPYLLLIGEYL